MKLTQRSWSWIFMVVIAAMLLYPTTTSTKAGSAMSPGSQLAEIYAQYNSSTGVIGISTVTNNATPVVNSFVLTNTNSYICFAHFFDATAANVNVGTTNAVVTIAIPAASSLVWTAHTPDEDMKFANGVQVVVTKGAAQNDNTHALTNDVVGYVSYQ